MESYVDRKNNSELVLYRTPFLFTLFLVMFTLYVNALNKAIRRCDGGVIGAYLC